MTPSESPLTEDLPFKILRNTWQPVLNSGDLPKAKTKACKLLDENLVVARFANGSLLAADRNCPHKGYDLSQSPICDGALQCGYHGWRFDQQGSCINIPSLVDPPANKLELSRLRTFEIQERYGMIWIKLGKDQTATLPEIPEFENPAWTFVVPPPMLFRSGFRREIENYLDMTHFAFAHKTTLGVAASPVVPPMKIEEYSDGLHMEAPFPALESPAEAPGKLQQAHRRRQRSFMPNFTTIRQSFADGDERVLMHIPSPVSHDECNVFWALAVSPGFDGPPVEAQVEFATHVLNEDRLMCESQFPPEVPINPQRGGWGVLVTPGDTLASAYQKVFRKWLLDQNNQRFE